MTGMLATSPGLSALSFPERKRHMNARAVSDLRAYCLSVYSAFLPVGMFLHDMGLDQHWFQLMKSLLGQVLLVPRPEGYAQLTTLLEKRHEPLNPDMIPLVYVALRKQRFWHAFLSATRFFDRVCASLTRSARVQVLTAFLVTRGAQRCEVVQTLAAIIPDACWPAHQVEPALNRGDTVEVSARFVAWRSSHDASSVHDAWLLRLFEQRLRLTLDEVDVQRAGSCAQDILEEEVSAGLQRVA